MSIAKPVLALRWTRGDSPSLRAACWSIWLFSWWVLGSPMISSFRRHVADSHRCEQPAHGGGRGMTMCLICAEVDLSVVGVAGLVEHAYGIAPLKVYLGPRLCWRHCRRRMRRRRQRRPDRSSCAGDAVLSVVFPDARNYCLTLGLAEALLPSNRRSRSQTLPSRVSSASQRRSPFRSFTRLRPSRSFTSCSRAPPSGTAYNPSAPIAERRRTSASMSGGRSFGS